MLNEWVGSNSDIPGGKWSVTSVWLGESKWIAGICLQVTFTINKINRSQVARP